MALETYRAKRDFTATPEPEGRVARRSGKAPVFVVQKHDATRLHYDFRLEMDGVLKSWAVTRGPSLNPAEKRLAVHVEDHPLDYGSFEGVIPSGYGKGTVALWDRGTWQPEGDPEAGYAKGHLEFTLEGEKLHGRWHLVRMKPRRGETRDNWLLIKAEDEAARGPGAPDILEEAPLSVASGRSLDEIAAAGGGAPRRKGRAAKGAAGKTPRARAEQAADGAKAERPSRAGADGPKAAQAGATSRASTGQAAAGPTGTAGQAPRAAATRAGSDSPRKAAAPAKPRPLPDFVAPELATLVARPPTGPDWIHEIKLDGYRLQARVEGGAVRLLTRSGLDWTDRFGPGIAAGFAALPVESALIDGELVVEGRAGASDFSALQADLSAGRQDRFVFYAFDLLFLDGQDLRRRPLTERKAALAPLTGAGPIRLSADFADQGDLVLRHACRLSLEGLVSKRADAPYRSGRTRDWLKSKCAERQEFVIAGYTPSTADPQAVGALLLGVHEGEDLVHVGRVGTGFSREVARDLRRRLEPMEVEKSPFAGRLTALERRNARYVRPELVAEVEFRAWTGDDHLRHAAFRGLREDKPAAEIRRERPVANAGAAPAKGASAPETPAKAAAKAKAPAKPRVALTHPDRIYWPGAGVTKEGLAQHYAGVWRLMAPHVAGRPLALLRAPEGIEGQRFFQKNAWRGMNGAIRTVADPKEKGSALIAIDDLDGLIGLVQGAALEIHPWGSTLAGWEKPDRIVMDLDPDEGLDWARVVAAAGEVRSRLEAAGLAAFVKTTGGKGLHVVAPLTPKATWPRVKAFARALAQAMADEAPEGYVATVAKARRKGRILIDWLRNQRGATSVAPYSTRARPGAPVSVPVDWEELSAIGPAQFTVTNLPDRLATTPDPWEGFFDAARPLPG